MLNQWSQRQTDVRPQRVHQRVALQLTMRHDIWTVLPLKRSSYFYLEQPVRWLGWAHLQKDQTYFWLVEIWRSSVLLHSASLFSMQDFNLALIDHCENPVRAPKSQNGSTWRKWMDLYWKRRDSAVNQRQRYFVLFFPPEVLRVQYFYLNTTHYTNDFVPSPENKVFRSKTSVSLWTSGDMWQQIKALFGSRWHFLIISSPHPFFIPTLKN